MPMKQLTTLAPFKSHENNRLVFSIFNKTISSRLRLMITYLHIKKKSSGEESSR